jgi:hypothetical protein
MDIRMPTRKFLEYAAGKDACFVTIKELVERSKKI